MLTEVISEEKGLKMSLSCKSQKTFPLEYPQQMKLVLFTR